MPLNAQDVRPEHFVCNDIYIPVHFASSIHILDDQTSKTTIISTPRERGRNLGETVLRQISRCARNDKL